MPDAERERREVSSSAAVLVWGFWGKKTSTATTQRHKDQFFWIRRSALRRFVISMFLARLFISSATERVDAASIRSLASLGPGGGGGIFAAVFHNTNPNIILAGQDIGGMIKSSDGGRTWRHVNSVGISSPEFSLNVYMVDELAAHPTDNNVFFACTASGLFRSQDVGETWNLLIPTEDSEEPEIPVSGITFSPLDSSLALLGTGNWHEPDEGFGMYRSLDGGGTFTKIAAVGIPAKAVISSIAIDPDDGTVYASTTEGLFRSADNGDSFAKVAFPFRHEQSQWIGIGGKGAEKIFWHVLYTLGEDGDPASRSGGIYRSFDGVAWSEITGEPAVNDPECNELIRANGARIHPNTPSILFLSLRTQGGEGGLYRYDGAWTNLTDGFDETSVWGWRFFQIAPEGLAIAPSDPNLMISCNELAILKTTDGGSTWTQLSTRKVGADRWAGAGAEVTETYDMGISNGILYVAFEDIGFWKSDDRGGSWKQIVWPGAIPDTIRPDGATEVFVHPSDPDRFYVALGSFSNDLREPDVRSEIHKSSDGGSSTLDITPPAKPGLLGRPALTVVWGEVPVQDLLYCAFHGDTLYKSSDGGITWNESGKGIPEGDREMIFRLAVDPDNTNILYAGLYTFFGFFPSSSGLYRSTDAGQSWGKVAEYPYQDVVAIQFVGSPRRLFVGGWNAERGALMVSDDGATFSQALDQPYVSNVIDAPCAPGMLYAVSNATFVRGVNQSAGIYQSNDNGATWTRFGGNLQHTGVWDMVIFPDQPNLLFMATRGDGVMVVEIDDLKRRFAQFGKGEGTSSTLVVTNPSATQKVTGKVKLFDQLGNPLTVSVNGTAQSGEFPFDVPGQGVAFFATDGAGEPAVTGWAEVEADAPFGGTILFSGSAGVALANPTTDSVDLTLRLRDSNADPAGNGNLVINLGPRSQLARFPEELFAGTGVDLAQFRGSLEVESLRPVIGMAIRLGPGQFATLPVAPMGFGQSRLHFAHFGDGSGVSSTLILVNSFADRTASGTVFLFDSQGDPLSVNINGVLRVG